MPEPDINALHILHGNTRSPEIHAAVKERFTFKQWDADKIARGGQVTAAAIEFVETLIENVPPSPARTRAINQLEEVRMLANAAITHDGRF